MEQCPQKYKVKEICRCCLENIGEMRPLYGFFLNEMLRSVTNLSITPNDGFPELLCFQCVLQLSRAYRFKEQCIKSHRIIVGYIEEIKTQQNVCKNTCIENKFHVSDGCATNEDSHFIDDSLSIRDQHSNDPEIEVFHQPLKPDGQNLPEIVIEDNNTSGYKCDICSKQFHSRKQLTRHIKTHNNNKPYKCFECNKTFAEKCNLNKHLYKHSGELRSANKKAYLCSVCGKSFKYPSSLAKHMKFHTGRNLLHCSECPKYFAEKSALKIHQRIHTGDRPYVCQQCNRKFAQHCNLRKHSLSHDTEKHFTCSICKHTFVDRNYLTVHMQTHLGKQSLCSTCGKKFANNKTLEAHMRVHDEKRLFACGFKNCNKQFSRQDTALIHRRIHLGIKQYSCQTCNQFFTTSTQLSVHLKSHSEQLFSCALCEQNLTTKSGLKKHILKHSSTKINHVDVQKNEEAVILSEAEVCQSKTTNGHIFEESVLLFNFPHSSDLVSETERITFK